MKPDAMITTHDFDKYWIAIEGDRLSVGKGEPGENKILSWRDPQPTQGIAYVGFGSWHQPVLIKNIKLMMPVITEEKLARKFDPIKVHDWFNQGRFSDVILKTPLDDKEMLAHRAVLFAASRPFEHLVRSSPAYQDTVRLCPVHLLPETLPGPIIQQILKYIYTGKVVIENAALLSQWAAFYEVTGLVSLCQTVLDNPGKYDGIELKQHTVTALSTSASDLPPADASPAPQVSSNSLRQHDYTKLYQRSLFSDVFFVVKSPPDSQEKYEKTLPMHKIVLALKSEPLGLMFSTGMRESTMKKIEFVENYEIFELMLRYIYSGQSQFLRDKDINEILLPLLTMADRFAVYPLRTALSDIFTDFIDLDNVCALVNVATFYGLTTLRRKSLRFIEQNFSDVVQSDGFLGLEAGPLLEIIFGDDLVVPSEKDVFDALMAWGAGDASSSCQKDLAASFHEVFSDEEKSTRLTELKQLLSYVRYPLMDTIALQFILEANEIVRETDYLRDAVQEALQDKLAQSSASLGSSLPLYGGLGGSGYSGGSSSFHDSPINSPSNSLTNLPTMSSSYGTLPPFSPGGSSAPTSGPSPLLGEPIRRSSLNRPGAFLTNSRKSSAIQLLFSHTGDENGAIYWIGTNGGTERWQNPHKTNRIVVSCSSPPSRWTSVAALVNRTFITNNFASGSATAPAWWCIDLTAKYRLLCDYYSIQTDGSANVIGDWTLEGSIDGKSWTPLRVHENSKAVFSQGGGKEYSWPVDSGNAGYRYFRLIVSGASAQQPHKFSLSAIELYGHMHKIDTSDAPTASSSSSSGAMSSSPPIAIVRASSSGSSSALVSSPPP